MPWFGNRRRYQLALKWDRDGNDTFGRPAIEADPTELRVRWQDVNEEMTDPEGQRVLVSVKVHSTETIEIGSILWLGSLSDWDDVVQGTNGTNLMCVKAIEYVPNINGRHKRRVYGLQFYGNSLPTTTG